MSSKSESDQDKEEIILVLDANPTKYKYICPLSSCHHNAGNLQVILQHFWKTRSRNAPNKSCTGQHSPSLILYPRIFQAAKFKDIAYPILTQEFPYYSWQAMHQHFASSDYSAPNVIALIQQFNMFITKRFLAAYPDIHPIPSALQDFILEDDFKHSDLPSILQRFKHRDVTSNAESSSEPPCKKRKTSATESMDIDSDNHGQHSNNSNTATLNLPSLHMTSPNPSSTHTNSLINHLSNSNSLSFDVNNNQTDFDNNHNHNVHADRISINISHSARSPAIHAQESNNKTHAGNKSRKRKRRRGVGPICNACNHEINPCHAMIQCAECMQDEQSPVEFEDDFLCNTRDVFICLNCFKQGKEFATHKRFHRYNVLRPLHEFKLNKTDKEKQDNATNSASSVSPNKRWKNNHNRWSANDEWNLLYGLRTYGLGNWNGITKILNKSSFKAKNECNFDSKHVESHCDYKHGHMICTQQPSLAVVASSPLQQTRPSEEPEAEESSPPDDNNHNHATKSSSASAPSSTRKTGKKHRSKHSRVNDESNTHRKSECKFTDKHKLKCGYKEKRDEFEAEWNNDAEAMIGEMYFSEWDTKQERALKMEGLRLYNNVLKERKVRKKFIKDYGVIYSKKTRRNISEQDLKLEEEITNNLSAFARYTEDKNHNFSEFKSLCHGLMEEKRLRERIYKLRHYLLNGITSLAQMETIEKYVQRQQELKAQRDAQRLQKKLERKQKLKRARSNSNTSVSALDDGSEDDDMYDDDEDDDVLPQSADECLNRYYGCSLDAISTYLNLVEAEENNKMKAKTRGRRKSEPLLTQDVSQPDEQEESKQENGVGDQDEEMKEWNLSKMKGFEKLNEGEKKLCNVLKIAPEDYKWIEEEIATRVYMHGLLRKGAVPQQLYVDIGDVRNVQRSMQMRIGLVDPRLLTDSCNVVNHKR